MAPSPASGSGSPEPPASPTITDAPASAANNANANASNSVSNVGAARRNNFATHKNGLPDRRRVSSRPFSERRRTSVLVGQRSIDIMAETRPMEKGPRFVTFIIKLYRRWGYFIADHDWQAILICCLISTLALYKVITTPQQNDITGYSPYGARARDENTRYQEFFSQDGLGTAVYLFALAKDGGTMLRSEYLKEVVDILDFTSDNFTLYNKGADSHTPFSEFCLSFCQINEPVRQFYNGFTVQSDLAKKGQPLNGRLDLKYPMSSLFGRQLSLQNNFYGIELYNKTENAIADGIEEILNSTDSHAPITKEELEEHVSNMKSVKMVVLQFRAEHQEGWEDKDIKQYEIDIVNYYKDVYKSKNLIVYTLAQTFIEEEMVRAGISLVPYLSVGFLIMCACAVISVVVRALYLHQHSLPKIILAIAACILPFMSCATALALMFLCGIRFASILCVIPFLVLAIGVDSSYLMIHEWQRVIQQCREQPNRRNSIIGYRIAEVLSEVGPAILISALTNILADAVGSFTSSPEITLLCVGNLTSMFIAFLYQMTCYTGLMSLIGRYEIKVEREERNKAEYSLRDKKVNIARHNTLTRQHSKFHDETKEAIGKSMWAYVSFIGNKIVASIIIVIYFVYLICSIWGITQININLSTQKLFAADSPLLELDKLRVEYQVPHFTMATVFVNNPGDLTNVSRLRELNHFVEDMEGLAGSWGPVGTKYFVRDFLQFQNSFEDFEPDEEPPEEPIVEEDIHFNENSTIPTPTEELVTNENKLANLYRDEDLPTFVAWPEYSFWNGFLRLENVTKLEKFFFTTAYHGKNLSVWTERGKLLNRWRDTVDQYSPMFDASVFHEDSIFLDLIENMPTDTWQSILGALICMGVVCYVFLNSMFAVTIATAAVLSICIGILGMISWWGIDLDPISMAAMIICIGSSCDLPAHTSFHYYLATVREGPNSSPVVKLANCLSTIAFPAIQAAISMILCVCSLLFVHLYMSTVFVKTMVLCVVLCNLHALVFIPAFLVMWDYLRSGVTDAFTKKSRISAAAAATAATTIDTASPDDYDSEIGALPRSPLASVSHSMAPPRSPHKSPITETKSLPAGLTVASSPPRSRSRTPSPIREEVEPSESNSIDTTPDRPPIT
uniref:SSD domain-containing protein n=1 Tax=Panagrellus redivivus TaxID=6233 RepID=A0A7E4UPM4_PANRE